MKHANDDPATVQHRSRVARYVGIVTLKDHAEHGTIRIPVNGYGRTPAARYADARRQIRSGIYDLTLERGNGGKGKAAKHG